MQRPASSRTNRAHRPARGAGDQRCGDGPARRMPGRDRGEDLEHPAAGIGNPARRYRALDSLAPLRRPPGGNSGGSGALPNSQLPIPDPQRQTPHLAHPHHHPALRPSCRAGGCAAGGPTRRDRCLAQCGLLPIRAGPSPVDQRISRGGGIRLGHAPAPSPPDQKGIRRGAGRRAGAALCLLPRLARSGHPRGAALRADVLVAGPAAQSRCGIAPHPHLSRLHPARALGHLRSGRVAVRLRAPGRIDVLPVERSLHCAPGRMADAVRLGGCHAGDRAAHRGGAGLGGAGRYRTQLRRHSARRACGAAGGVLGLAGLEVLARLASRLPGGAFVMQTGPPAALPWLVLLGAALWIIGRRNTSRRAALRLGWLAGTAGLCSLVPLGRLLAPHEGPGLSLHFLNVGQGDAAPIRTPAGRWILVDAGPAGIAGPGTSVGSGRDAGREVVLPFLVRRGVRRLAAFVLSHAHLDHGGGAPAVLEEIPADLILEPAEPVTAPRYLELLELAGERGMRWRPARAGDSLVVDGVRLTVLHPDTAWAGWRSDLNDDSVVLLVRFGSFQAVLAGDLGFRAESLLAGRIGPIDLLKVGHHGSAGSTGVPWLTELSPRAAVISVGPNRYGHPAPAALARLADAGAEVWRTDRDGSIQVTVQETTMVLRGRRGTRGYAIRP